MYIQLHSTTWVSCSIHTLCMYRSFLQLLATSETKTVKNNCSHNNTFTRASATNTLVNTSSLTIPMIHTLYTLSLLQVAVASCMTWTGLHGNGCHGNCCHAVLSGPILSSKVLHFIQHSKLVVVSVSSRTATSEDITHAVCGLINVGCC